MNKVYAKSKDGESLEDHTGKLLNNYELLKKTGYLNSEKIRKYDDVIRRILEIHDLGKLNHKFQNKIRKVLKEKPLSIKELSDYQEITHEWLSLSFISKQDRKFFKQFNQDNLRFNDLVKYCIAFHHTRRELNFTSDIYAEFVKLDIEKNKHLVNVDYPLNPKCNPDDVKELGYLPENFEACFSLLVFLKGILHKCDYSASADVVPEQVYDGNYQADFDRWLISQPFILRDYQQNAKNYSEKSLVLVASTGMGKTEFSMNWIIGDKAFYLLGIRTAVNEMYKRFENIFNKNVMLLHGEVSNFLVETADQLVTSVFKYNSFELPYFTASYSKIVVDEIQSFAPESIAAIVVFLKEIHSLGGKFLLMTATLPKFIKDEFKKLDNLSFPKPVLSKIKRHKIKCVKSFIEDDESLEEIKQFIEQDKKILIICNTVSKAQKIYEELQEFNPNLLHSRFINKDRREKEAEIMKATAKGRTEGCIWISTQIVEASLDIDFDILFTECAAIDSIMQRLGRCYRQREYNQGIANVYIYQYDNTAKLIYDSELTERTWNVLQSFDNKLLSEKDKQEMIDLVFSDIENTKYYQKYEYIKKLLAFDIRADTKKEAQKLFRNIVNNFTVIPEPVYQEHQDEIKGLINQIDSRNKLNFFEKMKKKNELMDFTFSVQIFKAKYDGLKQIEDSKFCKFKKIYLLKNVEYDELKGLTFIKDYKDFDNFI